MIVAEEYAISDKEGKLGRLKRIRSMVRYGGAKGSAFDQWFWSTITFDNDGKVESSKSEGSTGQSECFACHGSADNDNLVFLKKGKPKSTEGWKIDSDFKWVY